MTEEEIKSLQDAKEAAENKAAEWESAALTIAGERDKAKTDLSTVVEELKLVRVKKAEAEAKVNLSGEGLDVNALIDQALQTREQQTRDNAFKEALAEFKATKPEFQADTVGLVYAKFETGLSRFNFTDIQNKEQMKARLEEVYRFQNQQAPAVEHQDYNGTPSNPMPVGTPQTGPTKDIKTILEQSGMDEIKYNTLKTKYPDALESLGLM